MRVKSEGTQTANSDHFWSNSISPVPHRLFGTFGLIQCPMRLIGAVLLVSVGVKTGLVLKSTGFFVLHA